MSEATERWWKWVCDNRADQQMLAQEVIMEHLWDGGAVNIELRVQIQMFCGTGKTHARLAVEGMATTRHLDGDTHKQPASSLCLRPLQP